MHTLLQLPKQCVASLAYSTLSNPYTPLCTKEHWAAKLLPTWHLIDFFVQSQAFECLNCPYTLLLFSLVLLFTAKGIYLNQAWSGFELELPIYFRTSTWKSSKPSPAFRILPSLSSASLVGEAQEENQRSNLYLCLQQGFLLLPCVHF
jgi:hypothetical protein